MKGKFITLEGIEGVGKSSNATFICQCLAQKDIDIIQTREPGGTPLAEAIRKLLLTEYEEKTQAKTELLLLYASRLQHVESLIKPALARGQWVLSDRFSDASFAYQGGGRGIPIETIQQLDKWVLGDFTPNYTIILDAPVEVAFDRIRQNRKLDRFENEQFDFFVRVREQYLRMAKLEPMRYFIVDAAQPLEEVQKVLKAICEDL